MSDEAGQIERMLSERLDGVLTAEELARLDRALADDPSAAALARQYQALQSLLAAWRALPDTVNWDSLATSIADGVRGEAASQAPTASGEQRQAVDGLIQAWAGSLPRVDWEEFKTRVSSAVRREAAAADHGATDVRHAAVRQRAARRTWRRTAKWFATVGAPLAAAAIIAIVVWWPGATEIVSQYWATTPAKPLVVVALDMPKTSGHVAVTFEQGPGGYPQATASDENRDRSDVGGGMAVAIDSSAADPAESVDEVLF